MEGLTHTVPVSNESHLFKGVSGLFCTTKVVTIRLDDCKLLIAASNRQPEMALADYQLRWGIETLFAALKTRGFNLESTHILNVERLNKLVALLVLAFCWAMLSGLWLHQLKPILLSSQIPHKLTVPRGKLFLVDW